MESNQLDKLSKVDVLNHKIRMVNYKIMLTVACTT